MNYTYKSNDPLEQKIKYEYSPYLGEVFIESWISYRNEFKINKKDFNLPKSARIVEYDSDSNIINTENYINYLKYKVSDSNNPEENLLNNINWLIKRFEIHKRIYESYLKTKKGGIGKGDYRNLKLYIDFAELLILSTNTYFHLPSLNALIKCLDIILSYFVYFSDQDKIRISNAIDKERELFLRLKNNYLDLIKKEFKFKKSKVSPNFRQSIKLEDVLFIAADTIRSRGYAQALLENQFKISDSIIITSDSNSKKLGKCLSPPSQTKQSLNGIFNPNLEIPLIETVKEISSNNKIINTGTINSSEIEDYITKIKPNLIIYSGFGGEIVSNELLNVGIPFLHFHSGELPAFKGSTTIYYSLLQQGTCGVSAIILSSEIDAGSIVAIKNYGKPNSKFNLDYEFDTAIRADLLVQVMSDYLQNNHKLPLHEKNNHGGETYYVIHPLLKHLAMIHI